MENVKEIWLREEISIADDLLSYVPKLTEEFLAYHDDFIVGDFVKGVPINLPTLNSPSDVTSRVDAWKTDPLKYVWPQQNICHDVFLNDDVAKRFPTACEIVKKYYNVSACVGYSILERNAIIKRHTGVENRDNEYIRIHVPLIVPEGDIFFEVEGIEIDWSDIWGFNNQLIHSAHNLSDYRRLVLLIDIRRDFLGIPNGEPFDPTRETRVPPFVRGARHKVLHKNQR